MEIRDYNGLGDWSADAIRDRYRKHCERLHQAVVTDLVPHEHVAGAVRWVYPLMDVVLVGIKAGDPACIEIGVEFVESGHKQPFGRILHAKVARELRRTVLTREQVARLRRRVLDMLVAGQVPHEYQSYAKLLRRIGLGNDWAQRKLEVDAENKYVMRYVQYYERFCRAENAPE